MNSKSAAKLAACASLALFLSGIPSQKVCAQEQEKKVVVEDADNEKRYLPANSISVSSGYSWLSNEILTANGDKLGRTPTGFDVTMEYAHLWKLKNTRRPIYIGFSINGVGSRTKVKIPRNGGNDVDDVINHELFRRCGLQNGLQDQQTLHLESAAEPWLRLHRRRFRHRRWLWRLCGNGMRIHAQQALVGWRESWRHVIRLQAAGRLGRQQI